MSDYNNIIDQETNNFLNYTKDLVRMEKNFREYISKELSEESFRKAAREYSDAIILLKDKIKEAEIKLDEITEETNCVNDETRNQLNQELGIIWRMTVATQKFCDSYGSVSFTDEPVQNIYKEIYDKHLKEVEEFMYMFINVSNRLFSK